MVANHLMNQHCLLIHIDDKMERLKVPGGRHVRPQKSSESAQPKVRSTSRTSSESSTTLATQVVLKSGQRGGES
jgi:hypothetical protein